MESVNLPSRCIQFYAYASTTRQKSVEDSVYFFIKKKKGEGKPKKVVKIAGLNKFLRIYFARVREGYEN